MAEPIVTAQTKALLAEFTRSGVRELHIRSEGLELYLSKDPSSAPRIIAHRSAGTASVALPEPSATPSAVIDKAPVAGSIDTVTPGAVIMRAPNLGTFYGAPKPSAAAYVAVGSVVTAGAELCLIEVMKLFTAVRAEIDGRIDAILAGHGEMVEAGQPLFAIVTQ